MRYGVWTAMLLASVVLGANKKVVGTARGENQDLILNVTIYGDLESVKENLGDSLDGHYIIAEVKVEPKYGKDIVIDRDDFMLRTDKNGERSRPMAPSQIVGTGLVLQRDKGSINSPGEEPKRGWSMGGPIGMGRSSGGGGDGSGAAGVKAKMEEKSSEKADPRRKMLDDRVLPEGKVDQPVKGLLYFPMEGQKLKDLELIYGAKETRIGMRFKEVK